MEGKDGRREGGSIHDTKIHLAVFLSFLAGFHYMLLNPGRNQAQAFVRSGNYEFPL
jgi:hypothetical protein